MNPMRMHPRNDAPATIVSRRAFLKVTAAAGAGLTLGIWIEPAGAQAPAPIKPPIEPSAFLTIGTDNTITIAVKHLEMGQGTWTGLPSLVAEEMDAAWSQVRATGAPADASRYANLFFGAQVTGGSTSMANSFEQYRQVGAAARAMLVGAAAKKWAVPPESIQVKNGVVSHASGKKATFGELATAAASEPVPANVKLKDAKDFVFIGKQFPRTDSKAKSNGTAQFTQDVKLPGMLIAVVAHPPRFGARFKSYDVKAVSGVSGVRHVVEVPNGVAVVATSFWAAKKGRDALNVQWDEGSGFKLSSSDIFDEYRRLAGLPGKVARNDGDVVKVMGGAAKKLEATYEFPYLAHAAMEPLDVVMKLDATGCEVWNGEQFSSIDQEIIAQVVGLKPEQVRINMLYAGGSFGRRANPAGDYVIEAATIVKGLLTQGKAGIPVKLVWTREDDMKAGYYRPAYLHTLKAGLDAGGYVAGWQHRIVGQSINTGTPFEKMMVKEGIDATSVEGASSLPYRIDDVSVDLHSPVVGVPVLWWRSVGSTHNGFSTETFVDELAIAAGKDPVAFRMSMLGRHPRHAGVLELAAAKAGWGSPLAPGKPGEKRGRGIALVESFNSFVAEVAEVTVKPDKTFTVDRVVCAVDCGIAVNPDVVRAQMEGGIGFGLSAALYGKITLKDGVIEQSNFHDYPVLRINEMPKIDVHIVPSTEKPTGVGEPGVPPIAPAVANALAAATGQRLRSLPLKLA